MDTGRRVLAPVEVMVLMQLVNSALIDALPMLSGGVMHLQMTAYSFDPETDGMDLRPAGHREPALMAVVPPPSSAPESAWWVTDPHHSNLGYWGSVTVTHSAGRDAHHVVGELLKEYVGCVVAGAVTSPHECLVAIRRRGPMPDGEPGARATTTMVTGDPIRPGPVHWYPSAVYAWLWWWATTLLSEGCPFSLDSLPDPPSRLVLVDALTQVRYPLTLIDTHRTQWPPAPPASPPRYRPREDDPFVL